jgi:hypothetical protein
MQPIPAPALVMVQAACALGVLIELLDGPAAMGQFHQPLPRRVRWQVTEVPLDFTTVARHGTLAKQPPLRSRADAVITGGKLCAPRGPMHPYSCALFAEDHVVMLAPGDGLPAVLRQGLEDSLGFIQRRRTRLLRLAAPS